MSVPASQLSEEQVMAKFQEFLASQGTESATGEREASSPTPSPEEAALTPDSSAVTPPAPSPEAEKPAVPSPNEVAAEFARWLEGTVTEQIKRAAPLPSQPAGPTQTEIQANIQQWAEATGLDPDRLAGVSELVARISQAKTQETEKKFAAELQPMKVFMAQIVKATTDAALANEPHFKSLKADYDKMAATVQPEQIQQNPYIFRAIYANLIGEAVLAGKITPASGKPGIPGKPPLSPIPGSGSPSPAPKAGQVSAEERKLLAAYGVSEDDYVKYGGGEA